MPKNIHTTFDQILNRKDKERFLNQHSLVIWLTGLSGSGKTTIAKGIERVLYEKGHLAQVLDGDNIRSGINSNLKFSEEDRLENIRRISEVSKLYINSGIITINSFISPTEEIRQMAIDIIGKENFFEIFVNAPLEVCEKRDVKGLYKKAREGKIKDFTGISSPFEIPVNADLEIRTDLLEVEEAIKKCMEKILPIVKYK
ncbi:adenylyl-sulfate kinase [Bacteroidota bacterium]